MVEAPQEILSLRFLSNLNKPLNCLIIPTCLTLLMDYSCGILYPNK